MHLSKLHPGVSAGPTLKMYTFYKSTHMGIYLCIFIHDLLAKNKIKGNVCSIHFYFMYIIYLCYFIVFFVLTEELGKTMLKKNWG